MIALIDADILAYEFGNMKQLEEPDQPLEWEITRHLVDERVEQILEAVDADSYTCYLTDSSTNFRMQLATIKPYKGHRNTEKPYHWAAIRQHLIDNLGAEVQYGIEADDRLGIEQWSDYIERDQSEDPAELHTIICSRDKDLHMVPGWHYSWACGNQKESKFFQDETTAIRCFYKQLLTGDTTDNILGLYGVGGASQLVKKLDTMDQELDMFRHVLGCYRDRFGSYDTQFMYENAALLWMMREEPEVEPEQEVFNRLNELLSELGNDNLD